MRDPAKYETYLRPILDRLKAIDGRAPVSIMTCQVEPDDPRLQAWLKEGLSTRGPHDRPSLPAACRRATSPRPRETYDDCVDLMSKIPGNKPVAFRMPCCDSLNTPSPRFFAEIFNKTSPERQLPDDRLLGLQHLHARRPEPAPRPGLRPRRPRAVPQVPAVPVVRQHDRELSLSLRDRRPLLGVPLRRPQRLGGPAPPEAEQPEDASRT